MTDRRNPYLILGVDYGCSSTEASRAFASMVRRLRATPDAPYTIQDANWAKHQIEQVIEDSAAAITVYRVPADPSVYAKPDPAELLLEAPQPLPPAPADDESVLERVRDAATFVALAGAYEHVRGWADGGTYRGVTLPPNDDTAALLAPVPDLLPAEPVAELDVTVAQPFTDVATRDGQKASDPNAPRPRRRERRRFSPVAAFAAAFVVLLIALGAAFGDELVSRVNDLRGSVAASPAAVPQAVAPLPTPRASPKELVTRAAPTSSAPGLVVPSPALPSPSVLSPGDPNAYVGPSGAEILWPRCSGVLGVCLGQPFDDVVEQMGATLDNGGIASWNGGGADATLLADRDGELDTIMATVQDGATMSSAVAATRVGATSLAEFASAMPPPLRAATMVTSTDVLVWFWSDDPEDPAAYTSGFVAADHADEHALRSRRTPSRAPGGRWPPPSGWVRGLSGEPACSARRSGRGTRRRRWTSAELGTGDAHASARRVPAGRRQELGSERDRDRRQRVTERWHAGPTLVRVLLRSWSGLHRYRYRGSLTAVVDKRPHGRHGPRQLHVVPAGGSGLLP